MLKVLIGQSATGVVLATVLWSIYGITAGYSALLGSLICVIPNAFLALRLAVSRRDRRAGALMRAAYIGEFGKLALTVLMFSIVFVVVRPFEPAALFAGFIAAQLVTLGGLLMHDGQYQAGQTETKNGE